MELRVSDLPPDFHRRILINALVRADHLKTVSYLIARCFAAGTENQIIPENGQIRNLELFSSRRNAAADDNSARFF